MSAEEALWVDELGAALEQLFLAREEQLRQARVLTREIADRHRPRQLVEVVQGAEAVLQWWRQIHRLARSELLGLTRPPFLTSGDPDEQEWTGVPYRAIYDHSVLELPGKLDVIAEFARRGEQVRIGAVPVKALLADDRIGLLSLHPDTTDAALVVHSSSLLAVLRTLFERIWAAAVPFRADAPDPDNERLLTLLAAGMTDAAIARQFGWHLRTVQRRVRGIMSDLGVRTRFQAGLQAARRGWL
ncbi:hypothetical protein [Lentzea sp. NPDC051838]|uniref:hypothetical protein n=1 Tax=Lentzea sp. NPDC051838 TaxID=3154849 RepID=UPI00343E08A6